MKRRVLILVVLLVGIFNALRSQSFPCDLTIPCEDIDTNLVINIISPQFASPGEEFCVQFEVETFDHIISLLFDIEYDPSVIQLANADPCIALNTGNCLNGLGCGNFAVTNGNIRFVWFNSNAEGTCCFDGSELFEICFVVVGDPNDTSPITINGVEEITYGLDILSDFCYEQGNVTINDTSVTVDCPDLTAVYSYCSPTAGNNDGTLEVFFCGGQSPYNYTISNSGGSISVSGTASGGELISIPNIEEEQYTISFTDANGVVGNQEIFFILSAESLSFEMDQDFRNPTCYTKQNGYIQLTNISGGNPNYNFFWSNNEFGLDRIENLANGTYTVTVEDANGCTASDQLLIQTDTLKLNYTVIDSAGCLGSPTGSLKLTAEGGRPYFPNLYTFQNDQVPTDCFTLTGVEGGDEIILQVQDSLPGLCVVRDTIIMPFKGGLEVQEVQIIQPECFGERAPLVELEVIGATQISNPVLYTTDLLLVTDPQIAYLPSNGNVFSIQNVPPGSYIIEVEVLNPNEFAGCTIQYELLITEPDELILTTSSTPPNCQGVLGVIDFSISGGTGDYEISLNNSSPPPIANFLDMGNDTYQIYDLNGGDYELVITDQNDCTATETFNFPDAGSLVIDIDTLQNIECGSPNIGALLAVTTPACLSCDYEWFDENGTFLNGGPQAFNLGMGCYTVEVTDVMQNCSATATACLEAAGDIEFTAVLTPPDCYEGGNGQVGIVVSQGQAPYNYNWENFPMITGSVLAPIPAGEYCVTVTDANLCEKDTCVMLENPPELQMNIVTLNDAPCFGTNQGSIVVNGSNGFMGTQFFSYIIYDSDENEYLTASGTGDLNIPNIEAGDYTVLVTDGQCAAVNQLSFTIDQATEILIDENTTTITPPTCFEFCDGSITVNAMGGSGPYTYTWVANGLVSPTITGICGNQFHYVDIMDDNGCVIRDSIFLNEPDELLISLINLQNPGCFNSTDGILSIAVNGGTEPYNYVWDGEVSDTISAENLGEGIFTVSVTDDNNCMAIFSEELIAPDPIQATFPIPDPLTCFGDQTCITVTDVFGGNGSNYTFSINNSISFPIDSCVNVIADTFSIKVFDNDGGVNCFIDTTIIIDQPEQVIVDIGPDVLEVALGDSSVFLQANVQSVNPVEFLWAPQNEFECIDPLCQIISIAPIEATEYSVTVVDSNGCSAEDEIQIIIGEERLVYIPNAFSPNGDGYNDRFGIFVGDGIESIETFSIFDRWGNLVFDTKNIDALDVQQNQWDGKLKNRKVVPGIYAYIAKVKFIDGLEQVYKGSFTLIK